MIADPLAAVDYVFNLRIGDRIAADLVELGEVEGVVTAVLEHGWWREFTVKTVWGRVECLRLYRDAEARQHSGVKSCRLLRRRDNRAIQVFKEGGTR